MVQQQGTGGGGGRRINVDVDRATVARADVTRMTVGGGAKDTADDLLAEIKGEGSGSIKAYLEQIRNAVEDCCVGGPKGAAGSKSLEKSVDNLTKALGDTKEVQDLDKTLSKLNKNIEVMITTMSTGGGGGGGEGGGGGGAGPDLARVRATEGQIEIVGNAFIKFERTLDDSGKSVLKLKTGWEDSTTTFTKAMLRMANDTILTESTNAFNSLVETVQDVVAGMSDLRAATKKAFNVMKEGVDVTRQGVVAAGDFFLDDWNQLWEGAGAILTGDFDKLGDSIKNTLRTLETARTDEGLGIASILVNQVQSMDELGGYMKDSRTALFEGNHLRQLMKDEEANAALIETLSLQRRAGVISEMSASELGMKAAKRAETLALIAANTGMTVDQLMKQRKEAPKTWEELHALGRINDQQLQNFQDISASLGPWSDKLAEAALHGFDPILLYRADPDFREFLVKTGMQDEFEKMLEVAQGSSNKSFKEFNTDMAGVMGEMGGAFTDFKERFPKLAATLLKGEGHSLGAQTLIASRTMIKLGKNLGDNESMLAKTWNQFTSFFDNMFPGGSVGLMRAVIANTIAVIANTGAQMGMGGKLLSLGKSTIGGVGKVAGMLGSLAAKLAPLLLVAAKVALALGAAAAIGVGIGLLFNKAWEKISKFLGGAGSLGSDIADVVDEFKYAATGDPDSGAAPKKAMNEMTMGEKFKRYGPSWMDAVPGLNVLSMARRTAKITGDTRSMYGPKSPPVPGAPTVTAGGGTPATEMGGVEGRLDRVAAAVEEGNRHARETAANTKQRGGGRTAVAGDVAFVAPGSPSK